MSGALTTKSTTGTYDPILQTSGGMHVDTFVWDTGSLTWVKAVQAGGGGGGGLTDAELRASPVPVSASSWPLPTGASTSALQTQPGVDIGDVTVNNAAGAAAVNIQDGGNSITVDGAITVASTTLTGTVYPVGEDVVADGRQVVTTAGTSVQFASQACKAVSITAETDNTGVIVVGASTVVAAIATRRGIPLAAGDTAVLGVDNMNRLFMDSTVNGDGVTWLILA